MTRTLLLVLAVTLGAGALAATALASAPTPTAPAPTHYPVDMTSCLDGTMAQLPVKEGTCLHHGGVGPAPPAGSTALCKDMTYTSTKEHKNACRGHKGVDMWLDQPTQAPENH